MKTLATLVIYILAAGVLVAQPRTPEPAAAFTILGFKLFEAVMMLALAAGFAALTGYMRKKLQLIRAESRDIATAVSDRLGAHEQRLIEFGDLLNRLPEQLATAAASPIAAWKALADEREEYLIKEREHVKKLEEKIEKLVYLKSLFSSVLQDLRPHVPDAIRAGLEPRYTAMFLQAEWIWPWKREPQDPG